VSQRISSGPAARKSAALKAGYKVAIHPVKSEQTFLAQTRGVHIKIMNSLSENFPLVGCGAAVVYRRIGCSEKRSHGMFGATRNLCTCYLKISVMGGKHRTPSGNYATAPMRHLSAKRRFWTRFLRMLYRVGLWWFHRLDGVVTGHMLFY
jgi:hypothetical protein